MATLLLASQSKSQPATEALNVFGHFLPADTPDTAACKGAAFKRFGPLVRSVFGVAPVAATACTGASEAAGGVLSALWKRLSGESLFSAEHECAAPSVELLLRRCLKHDVCGPHELALALIYLHRVHRRRPCLSTRTLDKYVLAAIVLAAKFLQDSPYNNQAMATIARLPLHHLNRLEAALLRDLAFALAPTDAEWLAFWPLVARPA